MKSLCHSKGLLPLNPIRIIWRSGLVAFALMSTYILASPAGNPTSPKLPLDETFFNPGETVIHWTAPVDNGGIGRASGYDIRYQLYTRGPIDSDQDWQSAVQAINEPLPSPPGLRDSTVINGLNYGAGYYYCLRSFDASGNYSALSNSPLLVAGDTTGYDYIMGDVNNNGQANGIDVCYLVAYFKGINPPPMHMMSGDVNGDCTVNGIDVLYMVRYFKGGPGLIRGDCLPPLGQR